MSVMNLHHKWVVISQPRGVGLWFGGPNRISVAPRSEVFRPMKKINK